MGVEEEAGKVAITTIEGLRGNPMVLGLIVVNLMFLVGGGYVLLELGNLVSASSATWDGTMRVIIDECFNSDNSPMPPIVPIAPITPGQH